MANKNLNARIVLKHDTEENWLKAQNFIPLLGEIIIYDADETHSLPRVKIGNGENNVNALPFVDETAVKTINGIEPDQNGDVSIPEQIPDTDEAHQMLTTNADGEKVWEDKLCYTYTEEMVVTEEVTIPAGQSMLFGVSVEVTTPVAEGDTCIVMWDGVPYTTIARTNPNSNFGLTIGNEYLLDKNQTDTGEPFFFVGLYNYGVSKITVANDTIGHIYSIRSIATFYTPINGAHIGGGVYRGTGSKATVIGNPITTKATGSGSVAINMGTANGENSFASGFGTAEGELSHAEGSYTNAKAWTSHAEGYGTIANCNSQHVQGRLNIVDEENKYAHIVGNGSGNNKSNAHTLDWDGNAWFAGNLYVGGAGQDDESAVRVALMTDIQQVDWNENDSSEKGYIKNRPFYTGEPVENTILENQEIQFEDWDGIYGASCTNFLLEVAEGSSCTVIWDNTQYPCEVFQSNGDLVVGNEGVFDNTGNEPFLICFFNDGTGEIYTSSSASSHTIQIIGLIPEIYQIDKKYIPGLLVTQGVGPNSEVFNNGSPEQATGRVAHAEGQMTTASGYASHAEGSDTTASAQAAHAEGYGTVASDEYAHAEGRQTTASGYASHAEGEFTVASGVDSHVEGLRTIAASPYQHVQGSYNIADSSGTYLHIVGNGMHEEDRRNAHTIDKNGNAWYQGDVFVGGTDQDSGERLAKMSDLAASITTDEIDTICGITV